MPVICVGYTRWLAVSHYDNKYLSEVLHISDESSTFVLGLRLWPTYSHIKLFIMYQETIGLARLLVKAMIAEGDHAYGGPANATVTNAYFIPNCLTRIEQLLGAVACYEAPTQAQIDSVESCVALPLCSGLESSGILRQRAIDNSIALMWSHLNAETAPIKVGDKVRYLGTPMPIKEGGILWGDHLAKDQVYTIDQISQEGNYRVDGVYMNPRAFERV